jgi:hypothetical protein
MSENEELQHLREGLKQAIIAIASGQERVKELEGVITSRPRAHQNARKPTGQRQPQ